MALLQIRNSIKKIIEKNDKRFSRKAIKTHGEISHKINVIYPGGLYINTATLKNKKITL